MNEGTAHEGAIRLVPWRPDGLDLLVALLGDPAMMTHLGGTESLEKIKRRQTRYEQPNSSQFMVTLEDSGEAIGWVGYWERDWRDQQIYEIGWAILPALHGRGIATRATAQAIDLAAAEQTHRYLHAFPSVDNAPSNAICRKCGFVLLGDSEFEYPPGRIMRCNDWRFDLQVQTGVDQRPRTP
jgi:RimJ/RimL family protein N-acetyltransferase